MSRRFAVALLVLTLSACGSQPPAPQWQMNARGSLDRATQAYLVGDDRVADAEYARARSATGSTGQIAPVARVELTRCAARVASLEFGPCTDFESLRADAAPAERAYADYLAGRLDPSAVELLPSQHRSAAQAGETDGAARVAAIPDPLARLVAAGVLFEQGRGSPELIQVAVDNASAQGWRRPLLAWLGVQAQLAERGGDLESAARIRRRMALVTTPR